MSRNKIIQAVAAVALTVLAACGPMAPEHSFSATVVSLIRGGDSGQSGQVGLGARPSREQIEAQPLDLLRVSIISLEATTVMALAGTNGTKTTWFSAGNLSVSFEDGLLIGSRGFGDDLMGADVSGAIQSLSSGGNHMRTLSFLNGLGQIEEVSYRCSTVHVRADRLEIIERFYDTTIIEETCSSGDHSFKNTYWRDQDGVIWQSRQWISPRVGFLGYQRL